MKKTYRFLSDTEPTDEQLHLLMQEVAAEVKKKAQKSNEIFWEQLKQMVSAVQNHKLSINTDAR